MNNTKKKGKADKTDYEAVRDRAKGALWGLIVGDCLGSPIQFKPPRKDGEFLTEMEPCACFNTPAGYWTDDGSMSLCIIDSVNRNKGYDLRDIAETFHRWYRDGYLSSLDHAFDVGCTTAQSIMRFAAQGTLVNGGQLNAGNGSLMRHAPAFLLAKHLDDWSVDMSISDITHASDIVREQVAALDDILDEHVFCGEKTKRIGLYCKQVGEKIACARRSKVRNGGYSVDTMDSALWAFHKGKDFEDALIQAVNNGHDADSVGAVVGQIAGGYYGYKAIPKRWVTAVNDWKKLDTMIERFLDIVFAS